MMMDVDAKTPLRGVRGAVGTVNLYPAVRSVVVLTMLLVWDVVAVEQVEYVHLYTAF